MSKLLTVLGRFRPKRVWSVVVVAAGSAKRMQGIDKILAPLGDRPILARTLGVFHESESICQIVVVTREDLVDPIRDLCKAYSLDKVSDIVVGGAERVDSVRAGLAAVRSDAQLIAIHDGARPFLPKQVLDRVLEKAAVTGAAAPAIAITDTIKRADDRNVVVETVDRASLYAVQTPQVFQADLIRAAVEKAVKEGAAVTDDCSAVERMGMKVTMTPGDRENIKITTPFDMLLGRAILAAREEGTE